MCLGLGNGCVPKEKLTVIACKKCGRSWQVTESVAKRFTEQDKGICPNCRIAVQARKKKAFSLLKQDETEDIKSHICDDICRFANDYNITQEQLDEHCANCIVDRIARIESEAE